MPQIVRYFKLMYIVGGILLSNEEVCETVDQLQIAPTVHVKTKTKTHSINSKQQQKQPEQQKQQKQQQQQQQQQHPHQQQRQRFENYNKNSKNIYWLMGKYLKLMNLIDTMKVYLRSSLHAFNIWPKTLPKTMVEYSSNVLYRKLVLNSNCDDIYS